MKIAGSKLNEAYVETVVFPRGGGREPIVFRVRAVLDYGTFELLVPMPPVPTRLMAGQTVPTQNPEDPKYKEAVLERFWKRHCWMTIQSLSATKGLEWETVKLDDPSTWDHYTAELSEGLTPFEVIRLEEHVKSVNGLSDAKIKEAEKDFLSKTGKAPDQSLSQVLPSLLGALRSSQSGEPAKEPASASPA